MAVKNVCICAVQVPFMRGGAETHVESLHRELMKRGFRSDIVRLPFGKWHPKTELIKNCLAWRLLDLTEGGDERIDLVIATKFPSYLVRHPNKVTWIIHQFRQVYDLYGTPQSGFSDTPDDRRVRQLIYQIDRNVLPESRRIFTNAQNTADRLARYSGLQGEVLYHPPKHVGRYRSESYGGYVFAAGRLEVLKRPHLLVEAMQHVRSPVRCLIAGEGPERQRLEQLAVELGVDDQVEFLGFVSDEELIRLYANCLAVCYTPLDEDYGYVTLEAFQSRKPVITAYDAGGPLEFVEDGANGYVTRHGPEEIAARIDQLYDDRRLCAELGERGYETVKHITWDRVVEALTNGL